MNYYTNLDSLGSLRIRGFFVGWPNPPANDVFIKLLKSSYRVVIAVDDQKLVGFITAISDGVLSAYIPFLEVLPEYQSKGIGKELVSIMKEQLSNLYMVDLLCDQALVSYYEKLGMIPASGAMIRNYNNQSGV
ncbi:MAG: GNAT family N-acetyltransferase [Bdellovibrionales bacterium CG12_big_fil_rev_8_21_14_0_65_38_15]|nr:MAG: GNAT family N-acetyltransferase [Bdellovibrionales bacterium CG22_combo_CG10-13_8_21_14_all_38_13]PIQ56988.1 MAG: GNAT family N-acetyltransferase [Bdellovibrionales bacterium CG12_big_fil_rev_8_21_14_0_65_38_15]PIR29051.1 MAG: GNAT family N-acetyltransferase [Bdellovibrionales bacterium CG11_big_fil_rev_8_21_14_0_20_38_13]